MGKNGHRMSNCVPVRDPESLGALVRRQRKALGLTLQDVSNTSLLGMRFLSEMERGKPNVSLGKTLQALRMLGLDVLVLPRAESARIQRLLSSPTTDRADRNLE